ncbi:MAG TPA: hypothetical protein VK919_00460 [Solirubrobacterales bacterium]|nr:hypothetical protein [Solirubrobacterales bacterium]
MRAPRKGLIATAAAAVALAATACGGDDGRESGAVERDAPSAASFPAGGATLDELLAGHPATDLVILPAGQVFVPGRNRFGFIVSTVGGEEVADAEVAIYAAHGDGGAVRGPFPARVESLGTEPAFTAKTTADDPDSARALYASDVELGRPGEWRLVALVRDGDGFAVSRLPSIEVDRDDAVPAEGERAPVIHTPTVGDVGAVGEIDTRVPHSTLHDHDFAEVVGNRPVALVFATPALCQSRVCGPVVDVAEQVKSNHDGDAAFIYMEIYEGNDPGAGLREQVRAFNLPTEPWLFVVDRDGVIDTRIEGPFSVEELEAAIDRVAG